MAIQKWHWGKISLLWAWGIVVSVAIVQVATEIESFVPGFILMALLLAVLVGLSVITWKWLSGKEH